MVITRFAPSPTGNLHIGGARTALFNFLFSKNQNGKFYLRIEDTDYERSKEEFLIQIKSTLKWLNIGWDGEPFIQSKSLNRHIDVANELLNKGHAYRCYCTEDELEEERKKALEKKIPYIYNRKWRDRKDGNPSDTHVIRFKSKLEGKLSFDDLVQGKTEVNSLAVEDFIILRKDKKPTYNLSAAVDDYDMKVTHVIRGDDHKINTFKQIQIFESLKWKIPFYAHIPLIHSEEGKKLSKRDYASTVDDYKKIGILPESLRNYLLRLGWSHKDKEIFSLKESIDLFNIKQIGRSPSKLDMQRIKSLNEYYIKHLSDDEISKNLFDYAKNFKLEISNDLKKTIEKSIPFLKNKAKTLEDIYNNSSYIHSFKPNIDFNKKIDSKIKEILVKVLSFIEKNNYDKESYDNFLKKITEDNKINFKDIGKPLRILMTGSEFGPSIHNILESLGKTECVNRLKKIL